MAKASEYAGSFYRDTRALNYAFSESKLEGGMVYNQMIKTGFEIKYNENNGGDVTAEQVEEIQTNAHKAAFHTTMWNMPTIYLTNKLVLGNSIGGFNKSFARIFNESAQNIGGRILKTARTVAKDGTRNLNVFKDAGTGLKGLTTTIANAGVRGNLAKVGQGTLRYFSQNFGEAIQELSQEAISAGTTNYWTAISKDPLAGGNALFNASVLSGMGDQFSGKGFDVFISGFLMGGLVSGPQKLFFQGVPAIYQRIKDPVKYAEYKQNREDHITKTVAAYNSIWNAQKEDPTSMFDPSRYNFYQQQAAAKGKTLASMMNDRFAFVDETDFAKFQQIHTVLSTGGAYYFKDQLTDYMKMSDEDLATAFPSSKADVKNGKIRERLESMVTQIDKTEDNYEKSKDKFPNPHNYKQFQKGTRDFEDAALKHTAWEHARYLYMFTQDGFERALERSTSIFQSLEAEPLFKNMAANDITTLLDVNSIDKELGLLDVEVASLRLQKDTTGKVREKEERIKRLTAFKDIVTAKENLTADGSFDRRKKNALRKEFHNYVRFMAKQSGSFVDETAIDNALTQIVDYSALNGRAKVYDKSIQYLLDPNKFNEVFERTNTILKDQFRNGKAIFEEQIRTYTGLSERTELANQIAKLGIVPDEMEMFAFLETGDEKFLKTFYKQDGYPVTSMDKELYAEINNILYTYEQIRPDKPVVKDEETQSTEARNDVNDITKEMGEVSIADSAVLNNSIKKAYVRYSIKETATGKKPMSLDKWINSKNGKNHIAAFTGIKKIWIDNDKLKNINKPLTEAEIKNETGLLNWLQSLEGQENDLVAKVLNAVDLKIEDITGQIELLPAVGEPVKGNKSKIVFVRGNAVSLIELKGIDSEGEIFLSYQLVDQSGEPLSKELLEANDISNFGQFTDADEDIKKALLMQKMLNDAAPDGTQFSFDETPLNYGQLIYDQTGKEFVVMSQPNQLKKEGKLLLIASDAMNGKGDEIKSAIFSIAKGEFKKSYSPQILDVKVFSNVVSRLSITEPVQPYPYANTNEEYQQAGIRYNLIISMLSPEEVNALELVIKKDLEGGVERGFYKIPGKEENPRIQRIKALYSVGVRIADPVVQSRVDQALAKQGIPKSESPDGIFGFMQNSNFKFTNSQGAVINPANMTLEEYKNIINIPEGMTSVNPEKDLELAQNNFALNNVLSAALPSLVEQYPNGIVPISVLPNGLSFVAEPAKTKFDKKPKKLTELQFNSADKQGNYLIYQLELDKKTGQRTKVEISNLENEERRALINTVESGKTPNGQTVLEAIAESKDAYVAAVLLPSGAYALINIKLELIENDNLDVILASVIEQAQKSLVENKENLASFNKDFNDTLQKDLKIKAFPGYDIELGVTQYGKVQITISYNKGPKTKVQLSKEDSKNKNLTVDQKIQILLDAANNEDILKEATSSTTTKKGITLTKKSFGKSFGRDASIEEILDKTTTEVAPDVVSIPRIKLVGNSAAIQAGKNIPIVTQGTFTPTELFTDAQGNAIPKGPELTTAVSTDAKADIEIRRQEELSKLKVAPIVETKGERDLTKEEEIEETRKLLSVGNKLTVNGKEYKVVLMNEKFPDTGIRLLDNNGNPPDGISYIDKMTLNSDRVYNLSYLLHQNNLGKKKGTTSTRENVDEINRLKSEINAKYDAELVALGTTDTTADVVAPEEVADTVNTDSINPEDTNIDDTNLLRNGVRLSILEGVKQELETLKAQLTEGLVGAAKIKAVKESKKYQDLLAQRKKLESEANKVIPIGQEAQHIEDINKFITWASNNLPEFISIADIDTLSNNLKSGGVRVGAFVLNLDRISGGLTVNGRLFTGAKSPFKYHEAFHGVFRMLLTDTEITKYLAIARKEARAKLRVEGKNFEAELEKFKNSADTYSNMSRARLEQEYYEEYLADEFEKFKTNPKQTQTDSTIKSLFTRIMEWIQSVFKSFTKNELLTLFENIDAGKFKTASISSNQFVNSLITGISLEANALLPYDSEQNINNKVGYFYLDSVIAEPLVSSIAAMYIQEIAKVKDPNVKRGDILENVLNDFAALYDEDAEYNKNFSDEQKKFLPQISEVFYNFSDELKTEVYKVLNIITKQTQEEEYNNEYFEEEVGLRNTEQYNMDASMIGGFGSLSEGLRSYLATTTIEETDYFGNKELKPGVKLIVPINFISAYNGLLKAVKNTEDAKKMLQNMYFFGLDNPQTGAVVTRLLQDFGISVDTLKEPGPLPTKIKNAALFQSVVKGFTTFRVDYLFVQRDNKGAVLIYSAAQRDDINSQLETWSQAWGQAEKKIKSDPKVKKQVADVLGDFAALIKSSNEIIPDYTTKIDGKIRQGLSELSSKYSQDIFRLTGIKLSKQFIAFSIASGRTNKTIMQAALINANSGETPINYLDILAINVLIQQGADIFSEGNEGANSRLRTLAIQNAVFDETIGASVFKNPEGNLVYAHQLPTYHLKRIEELNDIEELDKLKEDSYLENNFLLNSDAFRKMSAENRQRVLRIAGSSVGKINDTEEELNDKISGVTNKSTYGNYTPQEFALSVLNSYTEGLNTSSGKVDIVEYDDTKSGKKTRAAVAPILIRVLEASNTGDLLRLPVIKAVKFEKTGSTNVVLTDETLDIIVNIVRTEYDRIRRESNNDTKTKEIKLGYNDTIDSRAYKLTNSKLLITEQLKTSLEEIAIRNNAPSLDVALKELNINLDEFKAEINTETEKQYSEFIKELNELQIEDQLSKSITNGIASDGKPSQSLLESAELLNLTYDKNYNLRQIFFNDWINTTAINDILLGDHAVTLINMVDAIKRAKMQNAAYYSAYTSIMAEELGVMHTVDDISLVAIEEPTGVSALTGKEIERSDAQMWMTTKAFRYMWFGFGKLTPAQAKLITRIEAGDKDDKITSEEIFGQNGYVDMGSMLNSKKLVYGDGKTFIKMSAFVLTPELTSNLVTDENGNKTWVAKENRKELHDLRMKLEGIEALPGKQTLGIAAPLSALKMLKQKVQTLNRIAGDKAFEESDYTTLSAKHMGLQVLTPSNKVETVDPTQIKNIVTSEQDDKVYVEALGMNVGQIKEAYNLATSTRVTLKFKNKRNLIFTFDKGMQEFAISKAQGKLTPNLTAFLRYATEGLKASQASSNLLEFFSTQDGEQKYDLNNPITLNKFEQLFLSYLSKGALAEKAPGHAVALVSDFGTKVYRRVFSVDENGVPDRSEIIRENVWNSMVNKPELGEYDTLSVTLRDNKEGVVILDRLRSGVKEYDKNGKFTGERYTEMLMPAHFKSVMDLIENSNGKFPDVLSKMFAVRIPSQDNHSTINVKHVDFLPAFYGSSAMFAQELIEISGADFDIDKVYMQIKEFYEDKGEFYEYGKQTTDEGKYSDYLRYVSEKVKVSGTIYAEALESSTDVSKSSDAIKALQILGLPTTKEQYLEYKKKFREPYEAPMNNAILDYKYALMGNTGVTETTNKDETPISYTAASLEILKKSLKDLEEVLNGFKERSEEDNIDINNIVGKIKAFRNNKGANIGAIVLPNVYLSLLTEYGIKINEKGPQIIINDVTYNDFGFLREIKSIIYTPKGEDAKTYIIKDNKIFNTSNIEVFKTDSVDRSAILMMAGGALRKQDIISSLITMATDNAKERLIAKLGLNKNAIAVVANLIALGVPLRTSLLLINNPMIQDIYSEALNKKDKLDPGVKKLTNVAIDSLIAKVKADKIEKKLKYELESFKVTDESLINAFNNIDKVSDAEKISILTLFLNATTITDFTGNMAAVAGLTSGLGKDISAVNEKSKKIDTLFDKNAIMDLDPIYKSKTWQSTYLKIFYQIKDDLLPITFLSASENFQGILNKVLDNMNTNTSEFTEETRAKISRDLLSYLTIKAYQQGKNTKSIETLSNNLIYPEGEYRSINDIVEALSKTEAGKDNFFLDSFAISEKASDDKNQTGLNKLNANTFRSLNAGQKVDLQNSFAKLYGSLETKEDAIAIVHYIMVKDGLQLTYGSLLEAISPFVLDTYLSQIETANTALRNNDDNVIENVFGLNKEELESEFVNNYLLSNINGPLLKTFSRSSISGLPSGVSINKEGQVIVFWEKLNDEEKQVIRIKTTDKNDQTTYKTYILLDTIKGASTYTLVETMGSNQQNPIGFMFGERPTYAKIREAVKLKNANTKQDKYVDDYVDSIDYVGNLILDAQVGGLSQDEVIQVLALQAEDSIITATEDYVNVNGNNIANISALEAMLNAAPKQPTQSSTSVESGVEISSNAKGLAAALTNPTELAKSKGNLTESYPVEFKGKTYKDAETAYQALKSTATKDEGPDSTYNLMVSIIKAKLEQHPRLVSEITKQGGSTWILSSTHQPTAQNSVWETGGKNWFIKSLNDAYLTTQSSTSVRTKLFDENDKELKKGSVVEYNSKKYLFWNDNNGKAQLINTDGTKFSGTPNLDKLTVTGAYATTMYDNTEYIVTDNNNIYSGATGNLVFVNLDGSTKSKKAKIIKAAQDSLQDSTNIESETTATTLLDSMSDLERELYEEFADEMESDYSAIENFWDTNIQKNTQAKENLRVNNNILSLEDLIELYNNGIYKNQEEFIEQIKQCNL